MRRELVDDHGEGNRLVKWWLNEGDTPTYTIEEFRNGELVNEDKWIKSYHSAERVFLSIVDNINAEFHG